VTQQVGSRNDAELNDVLEAPKVELPGAYNRDGAVAALEALCGRWTSASGRTGLSWRTTIGT
jgi:hypothetical protein